MPPLGGAGPWWADLGAIGGLVVAALGLAAIVLLLLGMPGFPQGSWTDYYGLAKVVAIGLVAGGATLFSRRRGKPAPPPSGETGEAPDNAR
ncbi:hypothetical protein GCM10009863_24330 [Streptomyces axinellae]|uniref:Integral membrane protein n=2 Tax=Streptomyces axinellae TaxID=552788 RepID=A0ABN3PZX7_9ACTN